MSCPICSICLFSLVRAGMKMETQSTQQYYTIIHFYHLSMKNNPHTASSYSPPSPQIFRICFKLTQGDQSSPPVAFFQEVGMTCQLIVSLGKPKQNTYLPQLQLLLLTYIFSCAARPQVLRTEQNIFKIPRARQIFFSLNQSSR